MASGSGYIPDGIVDFTQRDWYVVIALSVSEKQEKTSEQLKEWSWNLQLQAKELKDKTDNFKNE